MSINKNKKNKKIPVIGKRKNKRPKFPRDYTLSTTTQLCGNDESIIWISAGINLYSRSK